MRFHLTITAIALLAGLAACEQQSQYTSGKDYLKRHDAPVGEPSAVVREGVAATSDNDFQQKLRQAANVEPKLQFPLRVGLARIEKGELTAIPAEEAQPWRDAAEHLAAYGDFVAISPLLAKMTSDSVGYKADKKAAVQATVDQIRLAAARQHLDAVMIYEVAARNKDSRNVLNLLDITIIGSYLMPSASVETAAYGQGIFLDVMTGYPYGTVQATVKQSDISTSHNVREKSLETEAAARAQLASKMATDAEKMLVNLAKASKGKN